MTAKTNTIAQELNKINQSLEEIYTTFEIHKEVDLLPLQQRFQELTRQAQNNKGDQNPATLKSLEEVRESLKKVSAVMQNYQKLLEQQLNQVNDNKAAFKTYINNMYIDS